MKTLKNIGKPLSKVAQKAINGGFPQDDPWGDECGWNQCRNFFGRCTVFCD